MAGESPDRSKQRESSAEPTSGSAVPVPGSRPDPESPTRAEAPERPDPRLAVTRDAAPRGGVDTATRVLSRQELDAVRAKTEKAGNAGGGAAQDAAAPGAGNAGGGAAEDAEAPGAGDTEAGVTEDVKAEGDKAEAPEGASAEGVDAAADGAESAGSDSEGAKGRGDKAEGAGAEGVDAAADGAVSATPQDAEGEADEAAEDASAQDTDTDAECAEPDGSQGAGGKGDERLRAAVAAWVASGDAEGADEAAQDADARDEDAADAEDAGSAEAGEDDSDEPSAASGPDDTPASADGGDAPQGPPAPDDESRTGGAGGNTKAEGEAEDAAAGEVEAAAKAVDQPTAVFKAVRPAGPPVDQPTTMLKAPKPDAETPSERTSKFVALKPDIKPGIKPETPSPPAAPDVTAAVPQVGPERTTQQPLPPRPPLDLLAELTNTPPPPDTPVRTALRRVKIWTPLVLLLAIVFAVVQSMRPLPAPTLDLTAEDSYTFDGGKIDIPWPAQGQAALDVDGIGTFGSSGDQKPLPIASVAKVMTAYVILREHKLDSGDEGPEIEIDQAAEDQSDADQESTVNVTKGDKITQREALEAILIASANNVARLLARWDAGSEKAFVAKMNATAEDLGMTNTTYTDPSGLNNTTVSSAVDQVKLAKAAMKEPAFREVAAMMSYDDYKGHNHDNWNRLVGKNNVVGIKTGTTTSALGNLVFAAKKEIGGETRTVVGAVVRQPDVGGGILAAALDSGDQLIRAAQDALESATILKKGDVVGYVDDGLGGRTPVVATKDVKAVGWSGLKVKLTFAPDEVPHTAKAGTKVGTLTVGDGSSGAVKIPVALQADLAEPGFTDKLTRVG